jgi:pyruvate,water dikinase
VRVLRSPDEAWKLGRGDILVATATDPGWTPLFLMAGGVVLELGSMLSHGAVVAREYRLPAVVNVPGATEVLRDGQQVTIDGTTGRIYASKE